MPEGTAAGLRSRARLTYAIRPQGEFGEQDEMRLEMRILVACVLVSVALACQSQEERVSEYRARADSYLEDEQWAEAKIELLNLIQIDPEDAEAHFHLGEALLELKEYGDALWQYRESVRLDPEQIDWRVELASLEMLARQIDDAREQVDFILEKQPEHVGALLLRARLRGQAAEYDLMLADVDFVLELEPDHEFALIMRARTMAAMRRPGPNRWPCRCARCGRRRCPAAHACWECACRRDSAGCSRPTT